MAKEAEPSAGLGWSGSRRGRRSCGWSGTCPHILWSGKVSGDLVFADIEHHHFVGSHSGTAFDVKLHGLAGGLVLLLDRAVVHKDSQGVLGFLRVGFGERELRRPDFLSVL